MVTSPEPTQVVLVCPACDASILGTPKGYYIQREPHGGLNERWTLYSCPQGHPMLVVQDDLLGDGLFDFDLPVRKFPEQNRALSDAIPDELQTAHEEARRAFEAKAYLATVVMCGRTLEGACALQGIKDRNLQGALTKMKDQGIIDGRLWDWAQLLREVRNAGAHFDPRKTVTRQDAEDSIAFNEALLDYLYVLKERFDAMQTRRAPASTTP